MIWGICVNNYIKQHQTGTRLSFCTIYTIIKNDVGFVFTSSCLYEGSCFIGVFLCLFAYSGVQHILYYVFPHQSLFNFILEQNTDCSCMIRCCLLLDQTDCSCVIRCCLLLDQTDCSCIIRCCLLLDQTDYSCIIRCCLLLDQVNVLVVC
jgi:hypothetical protein